MSQILSSSSPKYTKLYHADAAIELKEKANALFRNKLFSDALSVYVSIFQQFGYSIPAPFTRVIWCNLAACFVELGEFTGIRPFFFHLKNVAHTYYFQASMRMLSKTLT